jgi:multiple sugar transport system permease protein
LLIGVGLAPTSFVGLTDGKANGLDLSSSAAVSVGVTVAATLGTVILSTLAGYRFARYRFLGSNIASSLSLAAFVIPL